VFFFLVLLSLRPRSQAQAAWTINTRWRIKRSRNL
jgi:hypothetical protein